LALPVPVFHLSGSQIVGQHTPSPENDAKNNPNKEPAVVVHPVVLGGKYGMTKTREIHEHWSNEV
jgi:hypothetical protein